MHRTPAGWKLLALAGLSVLVFAVPTLPVVVRCAGRVVVVVGLVVARLPARRAAAPGARGAVVAGRALRAARGARPTSLTGTLTVLRLLTLVLAAAVVTATTRVTEMVAVVERICWPLRWVGVRPARIGLVIAMALRFIPLIASGRTGSARPRRRGAARCAACGG